MGGESEKIVNDLDSAFKSKGIVLTRDKRDLGITIVLNDANIFDPFPGWNIS